MTSISKFRQPASKVLFEKLQHKTTENLHILEGISVFAKPGTNTYIMGKIGSGKTSLMNLLCDRNRISKNATLTGEAKFNYKLLLYLKVIWPNRARM